MFFKVFKNIQAKGTAGGKAWKEERVWNLWRLEEVMVERQTR